MEWVATADMEAGFVLPATEDTAGRSSFLSAQAKAASITITQSNLVFPHLLYYWKEFYYRNACSQMGKFLYSDQMQC